MYVLYNNLVYISQKKNDYEIAVQSLTKIIIKVLIVIILFPLYCMNLWLFRDVLNIVLLGLRNRIYVYFF